MKDFWEGFEKQAFMKPIMGAVQNVLKSPAVQRARAAAGNMMARPQVQGAVQGVLKSPVVQKAKAMAGSVAANPQVQSAVQKTKSAWQGLTPMQKNVTIGGTGLAAGYMMAPRNKNQNIYQ